VKYQQELKQNKYVLLLLYICKKILY